MIIFLPCDFGSLARIRNRLDAGPDQRKNANFYASAVHLCDAPAVQILTLALEFGTAGSSVADARGCGEIEVFFQCNLFREGCTRQRSFRVRAGTQHSGSYSCARTDL